MGYTHYWTQTKGLYSRRVGPSPRRHGSAAEGRRARPGHPLTDLWGSLRFDTGKLNMKSAGYGAPIEWHQDWAFYPHTNEDLAAVGIMIDDVDMENGPMMVVPGSHKGPIHNHHGPDGRFCGAMDPENCEIDLSRAAPCLGKAGSITIHHVRAVHGSATNFSGRSRRFLLYQYRAADAWPLLGLKEGLEKFNEQLIAGEPSLAPRLVPLPVGCRYRRPSTKARSTRTSAPPAAAISRPPTRLPASLRSSRGRRRRRRRCRITAKFQPGRSSQRNSSLEGRGFEPSVPCRE